MRLALRRLLIPIAALGALWAGETLADDPSSADLALAAARAAYEQQGPAAALPLFEEVLRLYRVSGDRRGEAIALGLVGNCHKRLGDPERALGLLNQALAMKRQLGDRLEEGKTLSHLGLVLWEQAEYAAAIRHFESAIALGAELGDAQLEGSARNNLALVHDELGDYERSLEQYRSALELYRRTAFPRGEGDTLGNLGGVHLLLGRYREAIGYYRQALAISERLGAKPAMSQDIGNIALCHAGLGEVAEALADFDRALALAREAGLAKEEADWLKGKGSLLVESGRQSEGLELFRAALVRYEASGLERERIEALQELASVEIELGDAAAAEHRLLESLAAARAIGFARGELAGQIALGDLEWRRRRPEPALAHFEAALAGALAAGDLNLTAACRTRLAAVHAELGRLAAATDAARAALELALAEGARLPAAEAAFVLGEVELRQQRFAAALERFASGERFVETLGEPEVGWRLAHGRGRALEALGREEEALDAYRRAVDRLESVRGRLREERFRAGYLEDRYSAYVDLARLLLRRGLADEAFGAAERLRARSYLDLLSRHLPPVHAADSERREGELRRRVRALESALESEARAAGDDRGQAIGSFSAELAAAERDYSNFLADLASTDPALAATWSLAIPPAAEIRAALPAHAALVEFVVGERELLLFVVTRESLTGRTVPVSRRDLEAKVALLRELIGHPPSEAWRGPAESLAELLVAPLESFLDPASVRQLYLVPHGALHHLPFAALPWGAGSRLLTQDFELTSLPSAGALVLGQAAPGAAGRALAVAPGVSRLRHAPEEARAVVAATPPPSRLLLGAEATETAFKRLAPQHRLVHLATHSAWNRQNPLLSRLELEPSAGEDGRLEVHEILDLRLHAELVTLSACETALGGDSRGAVPVGDDFVGLTRAFLHAGSAAVLASLWEVRDTSTLALMRNFYGKLSGVGPAAALAAAQRRLLADPALAHPHHWAAFVVVGPARRGTS